MSQTNGYVSGLPSTTATSPVVQSTAAATAASLAVYNNQEIDMTYVGMGGVGVNSFLATLLPLAKQLAGGQFDNHGLSEEVITNYPTITFKEVDDVLRVFSMGAAALVGDTTLTLNTTVGLQEGDVLRNTVTNEHVRINTVVNGTQVTVSRAYGTIAAQAMANAQNMIFIFNSIASGVASRTSYGSAAVDRTNYIQKFVETVEINDENMMSNKVTTKFVESQVQERLIKHGRDLEYAAIFGQKKLTTDASGRNVSSTEGALQTALRGWTGDLSGSLNGVTLEKEFARPFAYGSSVKIALCGRDARPAIRNAFENRIRTEDNETVNLKFSYMDMNGGKLYLVDHPFMDTASGYSGYAVIVDPTQFIACYPSGSDMNGNKFNGKTKFVMNNADTNFALNRGDWITYLGFKNKNANACGAFKIV